jgi:hypothetical protein
MVAPTVKKAHGFKIWSIRMEKVYERILPTPKGKKQAPIEASLVM